jgi:hypothetical protein
MNPSLGKAPTPGADHQRHAGQGAHLLGRRGNGEVLHGLVVGHRNRGPETDAKVLAAAMTFSKPATKAQLHERSGIKARTTAHSAINRLAAATDRRPPYLEQSGRPGFYTLTEAGRQTATNDQKWQAFVNQDGGKEVGRVAVNPPDRISESAYRAGLDLIRAHRDQLATILDPRSSRMECGPAEAGWAGSSRPWLPRAADILQGSGKGPHAP